MKALIRRASVMAGLALVGGTGFIPAPIIAQTVRRPQQAPPPDAPRFMVPTLGAREKKLGVDAGDEIRKRIESDIPIRQLYVIPKETMCANLTASGFPCDTVPDPVTARLLAQTLRADEFLEGQVTRTPAGAYRLETRMVLTRDANMAQPLPVAESPKLGDAARAVVASLREARKQLQPERSCEVSLAAGRAQDAVNHAQQAIAAYPNSTLGRVCLANAYLNLKRPVDSIIALTSKVTELDPRNRPALRILAQAYKDAGNTAKAVETWTKLLAADPKNTRLAQEITELIAQSGQAQLAKPIIVKAVEENPGDPDLIRLKWLILLATKDWKEAIATGEEMVRSDTAAADTTFFTRLAAAYATDSQPQKASETTARAVAKYPNNANLWSLHSQTLRLAGQTQQAVQAAQRAIQISPKAEHAYLRLAQAQVDLGQTDAAIESLRKAAENGEDKAIVGQFLLVQGNKKIQDASKSNVRDDFAKAITILAESDKAAPSANAKFLIGFANFKIADSAIRENQQTKSCELARTGQNALTEAQIYLPQGGQAQPDLVRQLMGAVPQYEPVVAAQVKRFCR
ncbi:MAG TPA: tetratricopeptide repeat protein [Gemmatimonadaceae bacterium]|nr:tetratricopeptide repeat protein [Gemmatimonadaceae bacterium]